MEEEKSLLEQNLPLYKQDPFPNHNRIVLAEMSENYAATYVDAADTTLNTYGLVHGGAYFTLADTSAAFAARTDGHVYVTTQSSVQFLKSAKAGRITAKSNVINRTKSTCLVRTEITDEAGTLLFFGTFNCVRTDK